jgi:hypothetical protein
MWFKKTYKLPKMTQDETKMYNVITNLIMQPDCIIEVNPDNMDYMLCLEKEQYFLLIDGNGVQFSNHGFVVIERYPENILDSFKHVVKTETIRRRVARRNEIFKNKCNLLDSINDKLIKRIPIVSETDNMEDYVDPIIEQ